MYTEKKLIITQVSYSLQKVNDFNTVAKSICVMDVRAQFDCDWLVMVSDVMWCDVKEQYDAKDTQTNIPSYSSYTSAAVLNAVTTCIHRFAGGPLARRNVVILLQPPPLQDL